MRTIDLCCSQNCEKGLTWASESYYDNDFVTVESGALETRCWKKERNRQLFIQLAPVINWNIYLLKL